MELTPEYIVGLVDGEGSFTVYVRNPLDTLPRKRRVTVEPRFYVKLTEEDKPILDALKKHFKCGNVYFQGDSRPNHKDCYRYEVANRNELESTIIPFFLKNQLLFPSKARDFKIFCKMMKIILQKLHLTPEEYNQLWQLKKTMHWARVARENRSLRGNINLMFLKDNRPSHQESW